MGNAENQTKMRALSGSPRVARPKYTVVSKSIDTTKPSLTEYTKEKENFHSTVKDFQKTLKIIKQLTKRKVDLDKTFGLHRNFKNLNPYYDKIKYGKAKYLADAWLEQISHSLIKKVEDEAVKNFKEFVEQGNKLNYGQLRRLDTRKKEVYIDHMVKEDENTREYLTGVQNKIFEKYNEIFSMI